MNTQNNPKPFYSTKWFAGVVIVIVVLIAAGMIGRAYNGLQESTNSALKAADTARATVGTPESTPPQTLLNISGSGTKTTEKFTASTDWDLTYSYDCKAFGHQGNFQVMIYNGDGSLSTANALVNQLGANGSDTEHYHTAGTYYLVVNSECSWKLNVQG